MMRTISVAAVLLFVGCAVLWRGVRLGAFVLGGADTSMVGPVGHRPSDVLFAERTTTMAADVLFAERTTTMGGIAGCASAGCHGRPVNEDRRDWSNAASVWLAEDPHRRAFEALYATRSAEIYLNLHPDQRAAGGDIGNEAYVAFLRQRCLGCHATVAHGLQDTQSGHSALEDQGSAAAPTTPQHDLSAYLDGVTCASCHGPDEGWRLAHYEKSWAETRGENGAGVIQNNGFLDLKNLSTRAEVCVACHVGPRQSGNVRYEVTHDLIAAGHPRLNFEFDAYLSNLPAHWDRHRDETLHVQRTGGVFHVDAWRFGQEQIARKVASRFAPLPGSDSVESSWLDLANYQCLDCHHALSGPDAPRAQAARTTGRDGSPRLAWTSVENLLLLQRGNTRDEVAAAESFSNAALTLRAALSPTALDEATKRLRPVLDAMKTPLAPCPPTQLSAHAAILRLTIQRGRAKGAHGGSHWTRGWDDAVQLLLAAESLRDDLPDGLARQALAEATTQLHQTLSDPATFGLSETAHAPPTRVTIYDSPAAFDPTRLTEPMEQLNRALEQIASGGSEVPRP